MPISSDPKARERQIAALSKKKSKLAGHLRTTKAFRFTLPVELADRLEPMSKADRDALMTWALENSGGP